jgi:chromosome segregation protein
MSRTAGLLSRAGEIEALRAQADALRKELAAAQADGRKAREDLSQIEASVAGINGELKTAREDLIRAEGEKKLLDGRADALAADIEALDSEKNGAGTKLAELGKALDAAQQKISELTQKEEQARDELEKLGVSRAETEKRLAEQNESFNRMRLESVACAKDADAVRGAIADIEEAGLDRAGRIAAVKSEIGALEQNGRQLAEEAAKLREQAKTSRSKADESLSQAREAADRRDGEDKAGVERRAKERAMSEDKEKLSGELGRLDERRVSAQTEYDGLISRLWEEYGLTRTEAEKSSPPTGDPTAAQKRLNVVKKTIKDLGGVNVGAIDEYKEVSERYEFLKAQTEDVEKSKNELVRLIESLTGQMRSIFTEKFAEINRNFSGTFTELFGGGQRAGSSCPSRTTCSTSGIEITVQPPGKIIRSLASLSGGEQAFVAIALYFAILKVRPAPFCVLDEIEAALDDANVERFAMYLKRMCSDTQFIVITHRRGTMDGADVLYGVTMQDEGVSKLLTLNVDELAERLGIK